MKTRFFAIFLIIAMLVAALPLFSCGEEEAPAPEAPQTNGVDSMIDELLPAVSVDVSKYTSMIYASSATASFKQSVQEFYDALKSKTSVAVRPAADRQGFPEEIEEPEILIGNVNRVETVSALESIQNHGWIIQITDRKIVIAGTTDYLTLVAMDYFAENYLTGAAAQSKALSVNEKVLASDIQMTALAQDGSFTYDMVYSSELWTKKASNNGNDENLSTNPEYPYDMATDLKRNLASTTRATASTMAFKDDADAATGNELLVGMVDRSEVRADIQKLSAKEYAVSIRNGKIMLLASNDVTLKASYELFWMMVENSLTANERGGSDILLPVDYMKKGEVDRNWATDFPKPAGANISLHETGDIGDDSLLYIYTGEGVNRNAFVEYCASLEAAGYVLTANETQWAGSSFRSYVNKTDGISLQVSHQAHSNAVAQGVDYFPNSLRVVSAYTQNAQPLPAEMTDPNRTWVKITEPMITSYQLDYGTVGYGTDITVNTWGNPYVMMQEDGSFVIFDGGSRGSTTLTNDHVHLYKVMKDLYIRAYGKEPTSAEPIRICAWVLTHEHSDHYGIFEQFLKTYGYDSTVSIDCLLYNFVSDAETYNVAGDSYIRTNLEVLSGYVRGGLRVYKIHTGQTLYFANLQLDVLYTHEDMAPYHFGCFNDTSTVIRSTYLTTHPKGDASGAADAVNVETCIWLGDAERIASKWLRSMYGEGLKADMVQYAHHGIGGSEPALYQLIQPEVVWWPYCKEFVLGTIDDPNDSWWGNRMNYMVTYELESVKMIIVADVYNTTLVLTENGPDYDNIFDAVEGRDIVVDYTGDLITVGAVICRK